MFPSENQLQDIRVEHWKCPKSPFKASLLGFKKDVAKFTKITCQVAFFEQLPRPKLWGFEKGNKNQPNALTVTLSEQLPLTKNWVKIVNFCAHQIAKLEEYRLQGVQKLVVHAYVRLKIFIMNSL